MGLPTTLGRTCFLLLGVKPQVIRVAGSAIPAFPSTPFLTIQTPWGGPKPHIVSICRCLEKPNKEQTGEFWALLRKQGPSLSLEDTGEKKLVVCCPSHALLPLGSGKQLAIQALGLRLRPAGMCSVPARRMGCPGQGSKEVSFPPPPLQKPLSA